MIDSLDDIFNDDEFGLLSQKDKPTNLRSDEDRMIDAFEEINNFYEQNGREPEKGSMSEYNLLAKLKSFKTDEKKKKALKPFDKFNLLGEVELEMPSLSQIIEEDDLGLLDNDADLSIYAFKHTPKPDKRAEADFVAQRKAITERDFTEYEAMFFKVHQELKTGLRKLLPFENMEKNLQIGNFYLLDGILLYLEDGDLENKPQELKSGNRLRLDGRTKIIFENATKSNMLYRSLGKMLYKGGKIITRPSTLANEDLKNNSIIVKEDNLQTGWIYVLRSKSSKPEIANLQNLYKIGFSTTKVSDRINNAANEATYLYSEVEIIASYLCYDINIHAFENLIHRFFANNCLNIDIYDKNGKRQTPREWFMVPLPIIDEAINLLINGSIINYRYDVGSESILLK
ncbi:GIY-YIG nuclease family protein [Pedobacter sp. SD-b]|uniref:GIY-YIG nuclease family protein n=1 Tax=Pedobacter segetis TaxID=2793069 RepID=A0ABS1BKA6_9SPHI|nr:GIY-YIG nuclease family protein [Pedobacter segetis]MBK0383320.1 GIY-YIG nuclease family protein [Pedobacter segetis]